MNETLFRFSEPEMPRDQLLKPRAHLLAEGKSEILTQLPFSPRNARCAKEIPSLWERDYWLDFLLCEDTAAGLPELPRK